LTNTKISVSGIVAFVWMAFVHSRLEKPAHKLSIRYLTTYIYIAFFFALTIVLITHLLEWNINSPELGFCYEVEGSANPGADQPGTEITYVVTTGFALLILMLGAVFAGTKMRTFLVISAAIQYGVHLYFMVVVRQANQPLLEGLESENRWDFGQTTSMLLLGLAVAEVAKKLWQYRTWSRKSDAETFQGEHKLQYDEE
jgi:hypothetical protein